MTSVSAKEEFTLRLFAEWLPDYCNDPERRYAPDKTPLAGRLLTEEDARDFLRALDAGVVSFGERQFLKLGQGKRSSETLFTEGQKKFTPRRVRLWVESLVTAALAGRLHLDYGWPLQSLTIQSKDSAFDLIAFGPDSTNEYIAVEVKKTSSEVDDLLKDLAMCCAGDHGPSCFSRGKRLNAHRKWIALQARHPQLFWAVGAHPDCRLFEVLVTADNNIRLEAVSTARLHFHQQIST